jgi:hypothetical protein
VVQTPGALFYEKPNTAIVLGNLKLTFENTTKH